MSMFISAGVAASLAVLAGSAAPPGRASAASSATSTEVSCSASDFTGTARVSIESESVVTVLAYKIDPPSPTDRSEANFSSL